MFDQNDFFNNQNEQQRQNNGWSLNPGDISPSPESASQEQPQSQNQQWYQNPADKGQSVSHSTEPVSQEAQQQYQSQQWSQWSTPAGGYYPGNGYQFPEPHKPKKKASEKKKHSGLAAAMITIAVVLSGTVGFAGGYLGSQIADNTSVSSGGSKVIYQAVERTSTNSATQKTDELSVADVAKLTADSVVEIRTESVTNGSFMQQYISEGAGSGVIITRDGYIVTNHHVIDGANKITVRLKNGDSYDATLIGKDAKTDIAVIKIEASSLTAAVYGDSSKLVVGETAIAIGNPLGELGGTVTSGIISALDRSISIDGETMTLLQTNAAINPGNSGGGLFNAYGELVGIVNAKSSGSDIEGLGFAIPINTAKSIIEEIMKNGYVSGRITLGITVVDIADTQTALSYRVSKTGVYVSKVNNQTSGFQAGDRIITFNGITIDDAESLTNAISACKVGQTVSVEVERRNQRYTFDLTLQEEKPE